MWNDFAFETTGFNPTDVVWTRRAHLITHSTAWERNVHVSAVVVTRLFDVTNRHAKILAIDPIETWLDLFLPHGLAPDIKTARVHVPSAPWPNFEVKGLIDLWSMP